MKVRKAVIPAAGFGTRMLPITSVVPKELLPVNGRPVIEHVVNEAVQAGITEIILVLSEGKEAVADYFRPNKRLSDQLLKSGRHRELEELERIWNLVTITVVYQHQQLGLGHAVLCAKEAVGKEPFAVLLGDSIIHTDDCHSFTQQLVEAFDRYQRSVVGVQEVEECLIGRYGIFEGAEFEEGILHGNRLVEKPDPFDLRLPRNHRKRPEPRDTTDGWHAATAGCRRSEWRGAGRRTVRYWRYERPTLCQPQHDGYGVWR